MTKRRRTRFVQRRKAAGLTQERLANELGVDRSTVVRWEGAETDPHPSIRPLIAQKLAISLAELDELLCHVAIDDHRRARRDENLPPQPSITGGGTTDRRGFTIATALSLLGLARPLAGLLTDEVRAVGSEHVALLGQAINNIEGRDAAIGGDGLYRAAQRLHRIARRWLDEAAPSGGVRDSIQSLLGDLCCWIGWLAFDADHRDEARRWLQEAVVGARLIDDPFLEVRAMTMMCLLTIEERPRESLQCAQAAQRLAAGWATPRLGALLHLRAARAHAASRDELAFHRELARAAGYLDREPNDDEPMYVHFVGPAEFAGITGLSYLAMGKPERAAAQFREIVANPDPSYQRNHGYYTVRLADALGRQGDLTGACAVGREVIPVVAGLESSRTTRFLGQFRRAVQPHVSASAQARDFVDAYDDVYTSVR